MNIFEYRPELKYVYGDINTINNIPSDVFGSIDKAYLINNPSDLYYKIEDSISRVDAIMNEISTKISHLSIPYNKIYVEEQLADIVNKYDSGKLLTENGLISFNFIQVIKNNPLLYDLKNQWEAYSEGVNGDLHAELHEKCVEIKKILENSQEVLDKTVNYVYNKKNGLNIKENQYLFLESYIKKKESLDSAIIEKNTSRITSIKKELSKDEARINSEIKISKMLASINTKLTYSLDLLHDSISNGFDDYQSSLNDRAKDVIDNVSISNVSVKPVIYSSFKRLNDKLQESKAVSMVSLSDLVQNKTKNSFISNARLYLDAGVPQIAEIAYISGRVDESNMNILIGGLEKITKEYEQSLLSLTNFNNSKSSRIYDDIMTIYEKNDAREIYKRI